MKPKEFSDAIRENNKLYRALFGYIPSIQNYSCTQESYIAALKIAVIERKELYNYLDQYGDCLNANAETSAL